MKKINKILLAPMSVTAMLPTVFLATSCNNIDYDKALVWYEEELTKAQAAFEATSPDASLKAGLSNVAEIERMFITKKIPFYWLKTIVNFRKDKYDESHGVSEQLREAWDAYYGSSGDERELYKEYKDAHIVAGDWLEINGDDAIITSCERQVGFYQVLSVLNGYVAEKGTVLKDLVGWGYHIINEADRLLLEQPTELYVLYSFNADVDGANVGYIYQHMDTPFKSPTLALYKYYTEYQNIDDKLAFYRTNILNFDPNWTEDDPEVLEHLYDRLENNFYLLEYTEEFTDIKFSKPEHLVYVSWALNIFIKRLWGDTE